MLVRILRRTIARLFTTHQSFPRTLSTSLPTFHTMPPKIKATRSKRKLEESASDEGETEGRSTHSPSPAESKSQSTSRTQSTSQSQTSGAKRQLKRAKTAGSSSGVFVNEQPTNTTLPDTIEIEAKNGGCLRIAAWNICSLASSQKKVIYRILNVQ